MREIITIHLGQAGVQVGSSYLELFCLEHGIDANGMMSKNTPENPSEFFRTFFSEEEPDKFTPRSIFVDLEPTAIDEIRIGPYKNIFKPEQLVSGKEDAANNYARGNFTIGKEILFYALDCIRKLADNCTGLQGFIIFNSVGGGTGSGFGNLLAEYLCMDYGKKTKLNFPIFPSPELSTSITENYNSVFSIHSQLNYIDCGFVLDNEAIYEMCQKKLNIEKPNYTNINRLIAQVISSITAAMRFDGPLNADLAEFGNNLIPNQRLKFMLTSQNPFIPTDSPYNSIYTSNEISESAFEPSSLMAKCDLREGKYMACALVYRGDIVPKDVGSAIWKIKTKKTIEFVKWCPTGLKCGIDYIPITVIPGGEMSKPIRSLCMIANNTIVSKVFKKITDKFDMMYSKKACVHWYIEEGMEESEFSEAREDISALEKEYEDVCNQNK